LREYFFVVDLLDDDFFLFGDFVPLDDEFFLFGDSVPLDDEFFLFGDSVPLGESIDFILGSGDSPLLNILSGDSLLDGLLYLFPPAIFLFVLFNIFKLFIFLLLCSILI
jgi:hypothetical protein